jgi:hypothetical protein
MVVIAVLICSGHSVVAAPGFRLHRRGTDAAGRISRGLLQQRNT